MQTALTIYTQEERKDMRRLCVLAGAMLLSLSTLFAQQTNLLSNGDFEIAESTFLGTHYEDWDYSGKENPLETVDVHGGQQAFRTGAQTMTIVRLEQDVRLPNDITGQVFELVLNYKIVTANVGDIALCCEWQGANIDTSHDSEVLTQTFPRGNGWQELRLETSKPIGATTLHIGITINKGADVIFDDFSLTRVEKTIPWFTIAPESISKATAEVGEEVLMATLMIRQGNLTKPVTLSLTGAHANMFKLEKNQVTAAEETVKVWYKPTAGGNHKAYLQIDCEEATADFVNLTLTGSATNSSLPATLTISPTTLPAFSGIAGQSQTDTIIVSSSNCTEYIEVSILNDQEAAAFTINTGMLAYNTDAKTVITFHPTKPGDYSATIYWSTAGATAQRLRVTGTAIAASENPDKDWATEFKWDMSAPLTLLDERFDNAPHNGTLLLDGWQNVVLKGERPWRGFNDKDAQGNVIEQCAKATAYIYQEKDSAEWEMWLVTPALDYKNAKAQTFTMRVRGDYLSEGQSAELGVYYIDATVADDIWMQELEVGVPRTADESGDWRDIHINLEGQEETIADVFFMAFRFTGKSGQVGTATYLIDDVSWGRTDLPRIAADSTTIILTTTPGAIEAVGVTVSGHNLTEPIAVTKGGSNSSDFKISPTSLPAEGGILGVGFQSDEQGVHEAYIRLSSRGAVDVYIPMAVLVREATNIENTDAEEPKQYQLILQNGNLYILTPNGKYTIGGQKL